MSYADTLNEAWLQHLKPKAADAPTVISTFAGCGGSSLGYSMAGYRELLAVEWDQNAADTFRLNFPHVPIYQGDIALLSVQECLNLAGIQPGELDVLDGSPPCQGFSIAGKRHLKDSRNNLFHEYVRLLKGLQPKAFVMENVAGLVKGKMKLAFAEILKQIKGCSYHVSARLMDTAYFGVPQNRQRLVIVGTRIDLPILPSHPLAMSSTVTVGMAIDGMKSISFSRPLATVATNIWKHVKPGQNGTHYRAGYYMNTVKIDPSKPSPTIIKTVSGTGAMTHWKECRSLSIEELKRLGSFPDQFKFIGKYDEQVGRIGNSVPPLFMQAIANHIRSKILMEIFLCRLGAQDVIKEEVVSSRWSRK